MRKNSYPLGAFIKHQSPLVRFNGFAQWLLFWSIIHLCTCGIRMWWTNLLQFLNNSLKIKKMNEKLLAWLPVLSFVVFVKRWISSTRSRADIVLRAARVAVLVVIPCPGSCVAPITAWIIVRICATSRGSSPIAFYRKFPSRDPG